VKRAKGRLWWVSLVVYAVATPAIAAPDAVLPVAGVYDGLVVAYDKSSRVVSGYFHEEAAQGQTTYAFYFSGRMDGNQALVASFVTQTPDEKVNGTFALTSDANHTLTLQLQQEHSGCMNVRNFADVSPIIFNRFSQHLGWLGIDVVKSDKAYFSAEPNEASRKDSFVVKGNPVALLAEENGWYRAEYISGDVVTSGYLQPDDLYGLAKTAGVRVPAPRPKF
jgi:hypothetical protein